MALALALCAVSPRAQRSFARACRGRDQDHLAGTDRVQRAGFPRAAALARTCTASLEPAHCRILSAAALAIEGADESLGVSIAPVARLTSVVTVTARKPEISLTAKLKCLR
jgi:hypothetical protein